jgi:GTP-binding protein
LKITAVRFLGAATTPGGGPRAGPAEVAIGGRSNVGKSSLINALLGRRGVARISATPGRTRQLNFFLVNERFVLVDLPGYGFAVGSEAERRAWGPLVETYLRERATLRGMVVIIDVRRGLAADDAELLAYLAALPMPAVLVATKLDKLGRSAARRALDTLAQEVGGAVPVIGFSARTGEGRDALWRVVAAWLAAAPREGGRPGAA